VIERPGSPAAAELAAIAERIVTELLPPVEMSGCTARMFDLVGKLTESR
jgi:hypothetical protein